VNTTDDLFTFDHIAQLAARCDSVCDNDNGIHALGSDVDPRAAMSEMSPVICR
jgi:hypothetical protein